MFPFSVPEFLMTMAACLFLMGVCCVGAGVFILLSKVVGSDLRTIAQQTAKLAQKGISDDVAGLVGNASALVGALNELVRTTTGIGVFLVLAGFLQVLAAYFILTKAA
jgi:hypothetical protein